MVVRRGRRAGAGPHCGWVVFAAVAVLASAFALPGVSSPGTVRERGVAASTPQPSTTVSGGGRPASGARLASPATSPAFSSGSVGYVTRTVFPGFNTSLPGSFTSSVATWLVGTPTYVPSTNTLWFPERTVAVPGDPVPTVAPAAVFNLTSGGFDRLVTNLSNASALAYNPGNGDIYATLTANNSVVTIDPRSGAIVGPAIPVGTSPEALAVDPNGDLLFVANSGSSNLTVVNTLHNTVFVSNVSVGTDPVSLAFDPQENLVFVANAGSKVVSVVNATDPSGPVNTIKVYYSPTSEIAYSESSGNLVATDPTSAYATIINASTQGVVTSVEVGTGFIAATSSANGTEFAIANASGSDVVVLDSSDGVRIGPAIPVEANATQLVLDPQSATVYCWSAGSRVLESLNLTLESAGYSTPTTFPEVFALSASPTLSRVFVSSESGSVIYSIEPDQPLGSSPAIVTSSPPLSIVADSVTDNLYVGTSSGLYVYNASTGQLNGTVQGVSGSCGQLVLDYQNNLLWFSNSLHGVEAVNVTTLRVVISTSLVVPVSVVEGIAVDSEDSETFVLVSTSTIAVLDSHTGGVIASGISVGSNVTSLVFDPADDQLYAAGDQLSLVDGVTLAVDGGAAPFGGSHRVLGAVYDPSREVVYIASVGQLAGKQGIVTAIDGSSVAAAGLSAVEISVGEEPTALGVVTVGSGNSSGWAMVWVANELSGTISVLSTPPEVTYFAATPPTIDLGYATSIAVTFQGGAGTVTVSYRDLPPGCSSSGALRWNCTPTAPGVFRIGVNVTDSLGISGNATTSLTVLLSLALRTTLAPVTLPQIDVGVPLVGTAQASDGLPPYAYEWSFGDGASAPGPNASHAYARPGVYILTAQVRDATGASNSSSTEVIVVPRPTVEIGLAPGNTTDVDFPLLLSSSIAGGTGIAQETWTFDDGNEAYGANATHAWTRPGNYTVTFRFVDALGATANGSVNVTVDPSLTAGFSSGNVSSSTPALPGTPVAFTSTISGGTPPYSVSWSFGDGSMATGLSVSHSYASVGSYTVAVTLEDAVGATLRTNLTVAIASASSSSGGIASVGGGFAPGLFLGLILGGVLAAVVLFAARPRKEERPPPGPGSPYVPP